MAGLLLPLTVAGSALMGGLSSMFGQRSANQTNIKLAREARQWDLKMWNMQNEYNSPEAQMERLKAGGLNPNLVYGSGNVSGMSSAQPKSSPVPQVDSVMKGFDPLQMTTSVLSAYNDNRIKSAQVDNIQANTELINAKILSEKIRPSLLDAEWKAKMPQEMYWKYKAGLADTQFRYAATEMEKKLQALDWLNLLRKQQSELNPIKGETMVFDKGLKQIEYDMQSKLKQFGVTTQDGIWIRILAQMASLFK